jgi:hypothetical protein
VTDEPVFLKRKALAAELTRRGCPIAGATLRTLGTRGGGPPYTVPKKAAMYDLAEALAWAQSRVQQPRTRIARLVEGQAENASS